MTTGGDFSYSDDSVVAKVSVDINANSLTSISQLTQAMSALRTEQEANARATSDWVTYLNEIPAISERANQAYRESITLMERMSYIQSEINGGPTSNVGPTANAGPGGRPTYSTAAAPGYVNPWVAGTAGMGQGEGMGGTYGFLQAMAGQDPRMYANMMAARGIPINPAMMGMVGGAAVGDVGAGGVGGTGGGQGWGAASPGSQSPQPTQHDRDSAAPPDPTGPWSTHTPDKPHIDAPGWQDEVDALGPVAKQVMDESRVSSGMPADAFSRHMKEFWDQTNAPSEEAVGESQGRGGAPKKVRHDDKAAGKPQQGTEDVPSGESEDGGLSDLTANVVNELQASGRFGGLSGLGMKGIAGAVKALGGAGVQKMADKMGVDPDDLKSTVKGVGKAGAAVGGVLALNEAIQKLGEKITDYSQLGSVQGGGAAEGFGYEMQARIMGMNPFISTEQARTVMQMTLREGFRGGNFDTVQQFMTKNFKDMGLSFSDSMDMVKSSVVKAGESTQTFGQNMNDLQKTMDTMKLLAKDGGASLPTREQQYKQSMQTQAALGIPQDIADKALMFNQQLFKGDKVLQDAYPNQVYDQIVQNPIALSQLAIQNGIVGKMPAAIPRALSDKGVGPDLGVLKMLQYYAQMAHQDTGDDLTQGASYFITYLSGLGVQLDMGTALPLYTKLISGKDLAAEAGKEIAKANNQANLQKIQDAKTFTGRANTIGESAAAYGKSATERGGHVLTDLNKGDFGSFARDVPGMVGDVLGAIPGSPFSFGGPNTKERAKQELAAAVADKSGQPAPGQAPSQTIKTEGNVTGNVTITVLQNGQVQAPPSIQLSGQQKSANAGYGGAQVNNAPPGDPTYNHAYTGWSR